MLLPCSCSPSALAFTCMLQTFLSCDFQPADRSLGREREKSLMYLSAGLRGKQCQAQMSCKKIKSAVAEHDTTGGGMGENSRINLSEVVSILGEDGGSLLARVFAPCLTLQQLFCFGLVNKKCNSIFRGNVWELLLGCRDVKDQDSLISRLVNGDKTDFLKKLVELKIIQVEGMCIILVCVRAHITSGVFECVRAPGCMFVCVSVCDIKKVLQVYLPTQYTITHTLIFSSLHTYSSAYLYM